MYTREIKGEDFTYKDALDFSSVFCVAFRNDVGCYVNSPLQYIFKGDVLGRILCVPDASDRLREFVSKAVALKRTIEQYAWTFYRFHGQPGTRIFIRYEGDEDEHPGLPVAISSWRCPYVHIPPLTLSQKVWGFIRKWRAIFHQYAYKLTHGFHNPAMNSTARSIFSKSHNVSGIGSTPENNSKLENMSPKERISCLYTRKYCEELLVFACGKPGRGIGSRFFDETLGKIERSLKPVRIGEEPDLSPPKIVILASDEGRVLYSKFGFQFYNQYKWPVEGDSHGFSHTYLYKNY